MKKVLQSFIILLLCITFITPAVAAKNPKAAPVLKETACLEKDGKVFLNFTFVSAKGEKYRVYRRAGSSAAFKRLGDITAKGATTTYKDTGVKKNGVYFYTVRRVYNNNKSLSDYDTTGIKAICIDTAPTVSVTTMQAFVTFKTSAHATSYIVYRKAPGAAWRKMATYKADGRTTIQYTDTYYKTAVFDYEKSHCRCDIGADGAGRLVYMG